MRHARRGQGRIAAALWLAATATQVLASGADGPVDDFVDRDATHRDLTRYEAGELGVVLPSYWRLYLYPAWRAIVLGREGLAKWPGTPGGLARAEDMGRGEIGWVNLSDPEQPFNQWLQASQRVVKDAARVPTSGFSMQAGGWGGYLNCPSAAFTFAKDTLQAEGQRPDATPQRLAAWVRAQDAVFAFCDQGAAVPGVTPRALSRPAPNAPEPLPASEPEHWRQLRDYQIAAAHFYAGEFAESARRFTAIGNTAGHPMRAWGAYLALRSHVREATLAGTDAQAVPAAGGQGAAAEPGAAAASRLVDEAGRILADKGLASVHEATRATVRTLLFRLTPASRFATLSRELDDPAADPHQDDRLGDWARLATRYIEDAPAEAGPLAEARLRQQHEYLDWMRTLQRCAFAATAQPAAERNKLCATERAHAMKRWQQAGREGRHAEDYRRAWLVAALSLADVLTPPLEKAALAVPEQAPESLTVRYHLVRLYRLAGQPQRARELAQAALASSQSGSPWPVSDENLFRQERFALATSLADATPYLLRRLSTVSTPDTLERESVESHWRFAIPASDGDRWINGRLAVADLLALAQDASLPAILRGRIAVAAWWRADLLGQPAQVAAALGLVDKLVPALKPDTQRYRAQPDADMRRHALVLSALRRDLSPLVTVRFRDEDPWPAEVDADDTVAGMWCSVARNTRSSFSMDNEAAEQTPPPPDASTAPADRDREMAAFAKLPTATGFVAQHVLGWARSHPQDKDLPWLLYVVVQSTRGGCLDPGASKTSKAAYELLHKRYPNNEWARKTPYWY